ncbi:MULTISPECIES: hypothetical protein [Myxococcus]|uniref:hypothetical protein n=1 Tax=Myxococcus TaxID=32 RepID=UPI001E4D9F1A|nr:MULTISPECIES: hypothetical protein [Myxococcus]
MVFSHWLPLLTLLAAPPSSAPLAPRPSPFATWFDARVKEEKPEVFTRYQVDLDGDGRDDEVVCYAFKGADGFIGHSVVLVGLARGERFALGGIETTDAFDIPSPPSNTPDSSKALVLKYRNLTNSAELSLRFDQHGPMLMQFVESGYQCTETVNLQTQRATMRCTNLDPDFDDEDSVSEKEDFVTETTVLLVSNVDSSPLPPGHVSSSQKQWTGNGDTGLKVRLRRRGDMLRVIAQLEDDRTVPSKDATPKAVLAADHLELWWAERKSTAPSDAQVQLAVARTEAGTPVAMWLRPPARKDTSLPSVRWTSPAQVEVDLPLSWLPQTPTASDNIYTHLSSRRPYLSVAFSDGDGEGQETLIRTFARFFVVKPGRRYPALEQSLQYWQRVSKQATLRSLATVPLVAP